ncbi:N-benzyl-3-pyrrolidinol dehydrogenase [Daedaleopsis nitida]|nr:N-benzyl-3-pyrrolidinol dehydrogenase [Daedaleopsis nitida]
MSYTGTMRGAFYEPGNNKVVLKDTPIPTPTAKQVLLKVAAAGVCHSDVFFLSDAVPDPRTYILGHENVGYAVQLGSEVTGIVEGHLYAVWTAVPCPRAIAGFPPLSDSIGIGENGGYAEYLVVNASELVPVPRGLAPEIAACAADSLITSYNALHNVAGLGPGTTKSVLIYGVGGLGHQAVQLAKSYGAKVYVCDFKPEARELALSLGAEQAFDNAGLTAAVNDADNPFTVDVAVDFVADTQSFQLNIDAVKRTGSDLSSPGGLVVLVGISGEQLSILPADFVSWHVNIKSSLYGTIDDLKACLDILAHGTVKPIVSTVTLENVNVALDALKANEVTGRMIITPSMVRAV